MHVYGCQRPQDESCTANVALPKLHTIMRSHDTVVRCNVETRLGSCSAQTYECGPPDSTSDCTASEYATSVVCPTKLRKEPYDCWYDVPSGPDDKGAVFEARLRSICRALLPFFRLLI